MTRQTERSYERRSSYSTITPLVCSNQGHFGNTILKTEIAWIQIPAWLRKRIRHAFLHVVLLAIIISMMGQVVAASPPDEASSTTSTSMNQSVTLDGAADEFGLGESSETIKKLDANQAVDQNNDKPSHSSLMIPPRGDVTKGELSTTRQFRASELAPVPWYRSGLGALLIVLVVIGASYVAIRKWVPTMRVDDGNVIKVLSRSSLSPKHQAVLVKVGKRMLLVGMTAESMTTLTELTDDDELGDLLVSTDAKQREQRAQFETLLGQQQDRFTDEDSEDAEMPQSLQGRCREPLSKLLRRLRQLQSSS